MTVAADARAPRRTGWTWLAVASMLLVGALVFTALNLRGYFNVPEVRLPEVTGLRHDEAAQVLRRMGLEPVTFVEQVVGAPPDTVTSQSPSPGATVKRGRTVHLGVNTVGAAARVPDLTGMREADARQRVRELNLPLGTTVYEASERPIGSVIRQSPEGGAQLAAGEELTLVVSRGRDLARVAVPDLKGLPVDEAVRQLEALGFKRIERVATGVSFTDAGDVVSTWPSAGTEVVTSTPVTVHYALSSRNVVEVPDVVGLPQWRAQLALRAAQLLVGEVTYIDDPAQPEGVIAVQPTGYTLPGTPVLLTVNGSPSDSPLLPDFGLPGQGDDVLGGPGGREPSAGGPGGASGPGAGGPSVVGGDGSRSIPFTFDPTFMGVRRLLEQPYQLELVVSDERGMRSVFDRQMQPGEVATTTVAVYGEDALLQTYIDGVFFQAWRP